MDWWLYPVILFILSFGIGIISVIAGLGGGSIFVPVAATFFPFNFAFIRGAGLFVTLGSSLSASHRLVGKGLSNLRLALPFALSGSLFSIIGAYIGLMADERILKFFLGLIMLSLSGVMIYAKHMKHVRLVRQDFLSLKLKMSGIFINPLTGERIEWSSGRTVLSFILFGIIGMISGIFGIGAGWAGVPVLNSIAGVPIMVAAGTSNLIIASNATAAVWVYIEQNALMPMIALPSFLGVFLGSKIGVRIIDKVKPAVVRYIIITFLIFSGLNLTISNAYLFLRG